MPQPKLERCPDDNTLGRLIAGELGDGERAAVEAHLGRCAGCAEVLAEYGRTAPPRSAPPHYELGRRLGGGAMGEIWEAQDTRAGRRVALKFVRAEAATDRAYQARLEREARALARIRHPGVIAVHELEQTRDGELVLALELIEGATARAWRAAARRSRREVVALWARVAEALAEVHRAGVIHRDLKPENVLVTAAQRVVVVDFGLASVAAGAGSTTLTATGQVVGTPLYMPLEQLRGAEPTAAADQFALCACLWEALAGAPPFTGDTLAARIRAMGTAPRLPLLGRALFAVLARGLDREPARRWPDLGALVAALAPWL